MEDHIRRIRDNIQQILDFVPADREIEECPVKYKGKRDTYIRDVYNWWLVHKGTDSVGVEAGRKLSSFVLRGIRPGKGWENSWCMEITADYLISVKNYILGIGVYLASFMALPSTNFRYLNEARLLTKISTTYRKYRSLYRDVPAMKSMITDLLNKIIQEGKPDGTYRITLISEKLLLEYDPTLYDELLLTVAKVDRLDVWCLCAALMVADMYRDNNSGLLTCLAERSDVFLKEAKEFVAETGMGPSEEAEALLKEVLGLGMFEKI